MLYVKLSPSASAPVGTKLYAAFSATEVLGVPVMVGAWFEVTVTEKTEVLEAEFPSETEIKISL